MDAELRVLGIKMEKCFVVALRGADRDNLSPRDKVKQKNAPTNKLSERSFSVPIVTTRILPLLRRIALLRFFLRFIYLCSKFIACRLYFLYFCPQAHNLLIFHSNFFALITYGC